MKLDHVNLTVSNVIEASAFLKNILVTRMLLTTTMQV
jgi:hypothetical protein